MAEPTQEAATQPQVPESQQAIMEGLAQWGKLLIANKARLMADNQRTLDATAKADTAHRDYARRVNEAMAMGQFGDKWQGGQAAGQGSAQGEELNILIDSPTTYNYPTGNSSAPTPSATMNASGAPAESTVATAGKAGLSALAKTLVSAALLLSGAGAGAGAPWLLSLLQAKPAATNTAAPTYQDTLNELEIGGGSSTPAPAPTP